MRMKQLAFAIASIGAAGAMMSVAHAEGEKVEKIEVTGTAFKRIAKESALPVTTIKREDIARTGATTAAELVGLLAANNGGGYTEANGVGDAASPGLSAASLRGLGRKATLVLLNGRRIANHAFGGDSADLNSIPLSAIDRIDVLRDGASAIYGADAVAGVINFITRRDYAGGEVYGSAEQTQHGGADKARGNVLLGFGDLATQRFNVFGTLDFSNQKRLAADQRDYMTGIHPELGVYSVSGRTFPARWAPVTKNADGSVTRNGSYSSKGIDCNVNPGTFPGTKYPDAFGTDTNCYQDVQRSVEYVPESKKINGVLRGAYQFTENHQAYAELVASSNEFTYTITPTPIVDAFSGAGGAPGPLVVVNGKYLKPLVDKGLLKPGESIAVSGRLQALGGRKEEIKTDNNRFMIGAKGSFGKVDYDAAYVYSKSKSVDTYAGGYMNRLKVLDALAKGYWNPFGPTDAADMAELAKAQILEDVRISDAKTSSFDFKVSAELMDLPAGPLGLASGIDLRKEELNDKPLAILNSGDVFGGAGEQKPIVGDRDVRAFFLEANVPILKDLEAQLAVRHDHYSDFGNATSPKVSVRWNPTKELLFRGSWGKGFRAPSLPELLNPDSLSNAGTAFNDPLRCGKAGSDPDYDCGEDLNLQFNTLNGGNRNLQPEKSKQWTAGIVWEPNSAFSAEISYWNIRMENQIDILSDADIAADLIDGCKKGYCSYIVRNEQTAADKAAGLPGKIKYINQKYQNLAETATAGWDFDLQYRMPRTPLGRFTTRLSSTLTDKYDQTLQGQTTENKLGKYETNGGTVIRWKHYLSMNLENGPWSGTVGVQYTGGFRDQNNELDKEGNEILTNPKDPKSTIVRNVGSMTTVDLSGEYKGFKNTEISFGIKNLFDVDPPSSNNSEIWSPGWVKDVHDPRGRRYALSVKYKFW
ncbi:TonB-dependent receptor [Parachitinimonas caeni]|uniref:TonB-dependent receptor n=1 Tax=Parachitinimonas caeni TaxID=3031301 RepID=A0ABT7DUT5_9NEIS|nr:TonB-dependent receptor [Parachitinimonas caeni]MDK2123830.1 TonB-dependent receptor [Parachitinimonas caeni]